jgi:PLP dependent protein
MLQGPSPVSENLARVLERMDRAAGRAGRSLKEVTLAAVTKTVPPARVQEAWRCGLRLFAESRVQEASEKIQSLRLEGAAWHFIGHLQTNKAKKAAELFDGIQSLDGPRLAGILDRESGRLGRPIPCLVEVKISPEPNKRGVSVETLERFLDEAAALPGLRVQGLMAVAPYSDDPEETRPYFRRLRTLFEKNLGKFRGGSILSMGMSHDFETAIEEGSTMIRVGTALFGAR